MQELSARLVDHAALAVRDTPLSLEGLKRYVQQQNSPTNDEIEILTVEH